MSNYVISLASSVVVLHFGKHNRAVGKLLYEVFLSNRLTALQNLTSARNRVQYHCFPEPRGPPANIMNRGIILAAEAQICK